MENTKRLIRNAIKTPDGTILNSRDRHDYKTHVDANGKTYMIDGGISSGYIRVSSNGDEVNMCLYDDEPHDVQREVLTWGSYGKKGDQPLTIKKISDMETEHIEAVLLNCNPMFVIQNCMIRELAFRVKKELDTHFIL